MGLFAPAWQSNDNRGIEYMLRWSAVEKETDQATLAEIAENAPLIDVRIAAAGKITGRSEYKYKWCGEVKEIFRLCFLMLQKMHIILQYENGRLIIFLILAIVCKAAAIPAPPRNAGYSKALQYGVKMDYSKAAYWFKKAAEHGRYAKTAAL